MKAFCVVLISLTLLACHPRKSPETDLKKSASPTEGTAEATTGKVSADPNPVSAGTSPGETTIAWDTGEKGSGEVYVSKNGKPEELFASGQSGSEKVKWIESHARYEFRLYEGSEHSKLLGQVEVTRAN